MAELDRLGMTENTLVIFRATTGLLGSGYFGDAVEKLGNHKPAGPLRGGVNAAFSEAGTRVPFMGLLER